MRQRVERPLLAIHNTSTGSNWSPQPSMGHDKPAVLAHTQTRTHLKHVCACGCACVCVRERATEWASECVCARVHACVWVHRSRFRSFQPPLSLISCKTLWCCVVLQPAAAACYLGATLSTLIYQQKFLSSPSVMHHITTQNWPD